MTTHTSQYLARRLPRVMAGLALLMSICACGPTKASLLDNSIREFNDAVRWKRKMAAAAYIEPKKREKFLDSFEKEMENRNIIGYEMEMLDWPGEDANEARLRVRVKYIDLPDIQQKNKVLKQTWRYFPDEKIWQVEPEEVE